jgi:hypothetical protein
MKITLTDIDNVKFDIDTAVIQTVVFGKERTEIKLTTGEELTCKENADAFLRKVGESVKDFFGGKKC